MHCNEFSECQKYLNKHVTQPWIEPFENSLSFFEKICTHLMCLSLSNEMWPLYTICQKQTQVKKD